MRYRISALALIVAFVGQAGPFPDASSRLLLFDDSFLETADILSRTVHQPVKHPDNPVRKREHLWEEFRVQVYGTMSYDPALQRYVADGRFGAGGRKVAPSTSEDFIHWSEPALVLDPGARDGPNTQFYGIGIDLYQGLYAGMLWMVWIDDGRAGRIDFQLCHSHDGIAWIRDPDRRIFIPNGPEGAWDSGDMRAACRSVVLYNRVLTYYAGSKAKHGEGEPLRIGMDIGLATFRRDGWVPLDAGEQAGVLMTKPFGHPGSVLHINADAAQGSLITEFLDGEGNPIGDGLVSAPP